jgi:predicted RNA binding protein YcfA (HicA-like mRNA interferase family)
LGCWRIAWKTAKSNRWTTGSASRRHECLAFDEGQAGPGGVAGNGWRIKRQTRSHKTLGREGEHDCVFAFHDGDEVGPKMLARIARHTGLKPTDL